MTYYDYATAFSYNQDQPGTKPEWRGYKLETIAAKQPTGSVDSANFQRRVIFMSSSLTGVTWDVTRYNHVPATDQILHQAHPLRSNALKRTVKRQVSTMWILARAIYARATHGLRRRYQIRVLERLSDSVLFDIGLTRSEIPAAVEKMLDGSFRSFQRNYTGNLEFSLTSPIVDCTALNRVDKNHPIPLSSVA